MRRCVSSTSSNGHRRDDDGQQRFWPEVGTEQRQRERARRLRLGMRKPQLLAAVLLALGQADAEVAVRELCCMHEEGQQ